MTRKHRNTESLFKRLEPKTYGSVCPCFYAKHLINNAFKEPLADSAFDD
jgi:hypothetical protein